MISTVTQVRRPRRTWKDKSVYHQWLLRKLWLFAVNEVSVLPSIRKDLKDIAHLKHQASDGFAIMQAREVEWHKKELTEELLDILVSDDVNEDGNIVI